VRDRRFEPEDRSTFSGGLAGRQSRGDQRCPRREKKTIRWPGPQLGGKKRNREEVAEEEEEEEEEITN